MDNSRFKFRAWDKTELKMREVININFEYEYVDTTSIEDYGLSFKLIELMQYTGLKDKNNKEIYEGDILKVEDALCKVIFEKGAFTSVGICPLFFNECHSFYEMELGEEYEVIGNIYENPELLK